MSAPAEPHHSPAPADTPATPPRSLLLLLRPASLLPPRRLSLGTGRLEPPTRRGGRPAAPPGPARPSARRLTPGPRLPPAAARRRPGPPGDGQGGDGRPRWARRHARSRPGPSPPQGRPPVRPCRALPSAHPAETPLCTNPPTPPLPGGCPASPHRRGRAVPLRTGKEAEKLSWFFFFFCPFPQACSPPTDSPPGPYSLWGGRERLVPHTPRDNRSRTTPSPLRRPDLYSLSSPGPLLYELHPPHPPKKAAVPQRRRQQVSKTQFRI